MIYAGIGPRNTAERARGECESAARALAQAGHVLRTGGADGADVAFLQGCLSWPGRYELHLPWPNYCRMVPQPPWATCDPLYDAYVIAARYHPAWGRCGRKARKLLARNVHVILGRRLDAPVDAVLVPQVVDRGGTGHALRVAAGEAPLARVLTADRWGELA